jgi:hypothetical protein
MSQATEDMNCTDYKEALTADPGFNDASGHAQACADCQEFSAEILAFNEKIAAALEIPVPALVMPELPEIETENVVSLSSRRGVSKPAWFAIAATVLLAAVVGIRMTGMGTSYGTLQEQVLAHVDHEPLALLPSTKPVSDRQLRSAVPNDVASMSHDAGLITYAQSCSINGKDVPHLVIQGARGPITILLMPHEKLAEATTLDGVNIKGIILPVGDGSIAIIGDREEQLDQVKKNVLDSVMWST